MTSTMSINPYFQTYHDQRRSMQKEQLAAAPMPQKHDSFRSRQRMYEIQMYEEEMRQQEANACSMSEHERQILMHSFASVKFEFSDLDGLTWSPKAKRRKLYPTARLAPQPAHPRNRAQSDSSPFTVLSNNDFNKSEDTIRASSSVPAIQAKSQSHLTDTADCGKSIVESFDDDDVTPLSTPIQNAFIIPQFPPIDSQNISSSRSLHIPFSTSVDKLILVDHSKGVSCQPNKGLTITPSKEKQKPCVRLATKIGQVKHRG